MSHLEIFDQPLFLCRLRDGDDPVLNRPPDQNLSRSSTQGLGDPDDRRLRQDLALRQRTVALIYQKTRKVNFDGI
jgi:hypothetical protein